MSETQVDENDPVERAVGDLNKTLKHAIEKGRLDHGRTWQTVIHAKGKDDPYFVILTCAPVGESPPYGEKKR